MYASVRRYVGLDPSAVDEIIRKVEDGFAPILSEQPGFIAYYNIDAGNGVMVSVSIFEDRAGANASNRAAAGWVSENLASLIQTPPQVTAGKVRTNRTAQDSQKK